MVFLEVVRRLLPLALGRCAVSGNIKYLVFRNAVQALRTVRAVSGLLLFNFSLPWNRLLVFLLPFFKFSYVSAL